MSDHDVDGRRRLSKRRKGKRWAIWLCSPGTLRMLLVLTRLVDLIRRFWD